MTNHGGPFCLVVSFIAITLTCLESAMPLETPVNHALKAGVHILLRDQDGTKQWIAPNESRYPVAHIETFLNRYTTLSKVYRDYDEAILNNRDNARFMLNDVGVRECLDSRRRSVGLLNWHLEPEDDKSQHQKEFCHEVEKVIRRINNFTMYKRVMQNAIWFGKYGMMHRWRADIVNGRSVWMPKGAHSDDKGWRPLHGDKIVFRQTRPMNVPGAYEGQMGIRVGFMDHKVGDVIKGRWRIENTDYGLAYFLTPQERSDLMLIHKHDVEDAAYEDGLRAGSIHGVGIRSVIYWEWVQKQETQAFLMEFVERMAGGIQMWKYPQGNQQALAEMRAAAENYNSGKEHIMLVPVPMDAGNNQYGVEVIEGGFNGIEALQHMIKDYFNDRVKRYILGQKLSSEAEATGMGSGVAELHMDTLLQIIKSDATSQEETLTTDLVDPIVRVNVKRGVWMDPGFRPRFVNETEEDDIQQKLEGVLQLMDRKIKFRLKDLYDLVGMAMPSKEDQVNPEMEPPQQPGAEGMEGGLPGVSGKPPMVDGKPQGPPQTPGDDGELPEARGHDDDGAGGKDDNSATNGHGYSEQHLQRYRRELASKNARLKL